jgi:hypothetical protein
MQGERLLPSFAHRREIPGGGATLTMPFPNSLKTPESKHTFQGLALSWLAFSCRLVARAERPFVAVTVRTLVGTCRALFTFELCSLSSFVLFRALLTLHTSLVAQLVRGNKG